jgi:glycosyltransferase involved in cell wall biosynthesis
MRIAVLTQYFWPESFQINEIVGSLTEAGVEVEVLTGKPNYPQGQIYPGYSAWGCLRERREGVDINRIPILPRGNRGFQLALNYLSFVVSGMIFAPWLLRGKRYDVIFVYAPSPIIQALPAIFLGWIKGCPVVLWIQDLWPESLSATGYVTNRSILGLVRMAVRFIYRQCDLLLVQSLAFVQPVRNLAAKTPVAYFPNSVSLVSSSLSTKIVSGVEGMTKGFSVVFTGNIGSAQAVDVIIDAAVLLKEYSDIHFVLIGDGSCRGDACLSVERLGLKNFHLPGRFPVETMPSFMQSASVLLVSLADKPIFALTIPNKVQAYLAAGRPIIACMNGEGARIVTEANAGLTAPAGNAAALAEAIHKMYLMSPSARDEMGANGRRYHQKHFDRHHLIGELTGYFKSVSERKGKSL